MLSPGETAPQQSKATSVKGIPTFINTELKAYSLYSVERAIPSVIDGLKPSQRKVLHACFKRRMTSPSKEAKVAQLAGYCGEHTAYHHGEASLISTIVNMAHGYVGAANLPLLYPSGQFGTRLQGGKDAASARYIYTYLQPYTRLLFPEADDPVLDKREDEGLEIEPEFFVPVIPTVLVNGALGIATGWATRVLTYHPLEVIERIESKLGGEKVAPLRPWARGFKGEIKATTSHGAIQVISPRRVRIVELPLGVWTESYKKTLIELESKGVVKSFEEQNTEETVQFDVELAAPIAERDARAELKLASRHRKSMFLHAPQGTLRHYRDERDVIDDFYDVRMDFYAKRKGYQMDQSGDKLHLVENRSRFVEQVCSGNWT